MDIENFHFNLFSLIDSDQINTFLEQAPALVGAFSLQED
jgi:hypothetical protein